MKGLKLLIVYCMFFIFVIGAHAFMPLSLIIKEDKINVNEGGNLELKIYSANEGQLGYNWTYFNVEYDDSIFSFVSYEGIGNTMFNVEEKYLYVENDITDVKEDQYIGTLILKVKDNVNNIKSTISYQTSYEFDFNNDTVEILIGNVDDTNNDNTDNNIDDDEINNDNTDNNIENDNVINKDNTNNNTQDDNKLSTALIIYIYIVAIIFIPILVKIFIMLRKNNKALQ